MRHWEDHTCVRFVPRTTQTHYIVFFSGDGYVFLYTNFVILNNIATLAFCVVYRCYSYVGRLHSIYQPQGVSLGPGCVTFNTAAHEIGHAIGFYHEHTRADRDEYISVLTSNIRDGQAGNFQKFGVGQALTFGYGYDYASIMHYRGNSFQRQRGSSTIIAKDANIVFGSARELSPLDILKANALYSCCKYSLPVLTIIISRATIVIEGS